MVIAGVMSGSSLDGLDVAIVQFNDDNNWELQHVLDCPYDVTWVQRLKDYHKLSAVEYILMKVEYSRYVAFLLDTLLQGNKKEIDYISFHGHTLVHLPESHTTEQIGNGGILAALMNIPTITDFRIQDVQKGGVGTPMAPIVERDLFGGHDYYLNLGGIANLTKFDGSSKILAYDVCPCNQVLNHFSNKLGFNYDDGGQIAKSGTLNEGVISYLNRIQYMQEAPPKSLDNNWIQNEFIPGIPTSKIEDVLHTYVVWMSTAIADQVSADQKSLSLMVSGGGTHNSFFMSCLEEALSQKGCHLYIPNKEIIDFKEAILMSLLAHKYLKEEVNILSSVTGAHTDSIGGALYKVPK